MKEIIGFGIAGNFALHLEQAGEEQSFVECSKCDTFVELKDSTLRNGKYICKECLK